MDVLLKKKISFNLIFLLFLALILTTVFRLSLLFFFPFLILIVGYLYQFKITSTFLILLMFALGSWILSFRHGFYLKYNFLSLFYFIPFIFLFFSEVSTKVIRANTFKHFILILSFFALINNIIGIIQYANFPGDDNFVGIYGRFTVTQNGLSLLNSILFFYYLQLYMTWRKSIHLVATLFFISCTVLAFYGGGLVMLLAALVLFYIRISFKSIFKLFFLVIILGVIIYFLMKIVSPKTLDYNLNIIDKFWNASVDNAPRKLIAFYNYLISYSNNLLDFLFGSGPGTFNSRSAFMVGSPTYFNAEFIKSDVQPYYFQNFAYPLWNVSNTGPYDGFMNQPFSSLLALLGEYGIIFTLLFLGAVRKQYLSMRRWVKGKALVREQILFADFYKFLLLFFLLLLVIDNYMEYPEISGLFLILMRFVEYQIKVLGNIEAKAVSNDSP